MASPSDMRKEPPAAIVQVQVQWCGTNYPVGVKADGNIGELKRKACEVTGLPSKRQKHMNPKNKEFNDDYPIGLLQPPPMTDLISLNNKVATNIYRNHFYEKNPTCTVKATKVCIVDFDESRIKLYNGKYQLGSMEIDCLIKFYKKEDRADLLRSIELMRTWKHPNLVVLENLYKEKSNPVQRLVLSKTVNGSLQGYINSSMEKGKNVISNANGTFTDFFIKMILDLCAVLDQMVKRKICPRKLGMENLYLKSMENAEPELKILFDNVDRLDESQEKHLLTTLCTEIKAICTSNGSIHKDVGTEAFCNFLGKEAMMFIGKNLAKTAMHYPISWTNEQKSKYLIDLIPSSVEVRAAINACGIMWPTNEDGDMCQELQKLKKLVDTENDKIRKERQALEEEKQRLEEEKEKIIQEKVDDEESRKEKLDMIAGNLAKNKQAAYKLRPEIIWNYDIKYAHDLVRLIRNLWKHYDTYPLAIKSHLVSKDTILAALEKWCPNVWALMYNAVCLDEVLTKAGYDVAM